MSEPTCSYVWTWLETCAFPSARQCSHCKQWFCRQHYEQHVRMLSRRGIAAL